MKKRAVLVYAVLAAVIGIFLVGCATAPSGSSSTPTQANLLTQAGFKAHTPQSPQRVALVDTLPAKKVVVNQYNKPLYLVCTDQDTNQCYLGDKAAYDRYQQLAIQNAIPEDQHKVSEQRSDPEWWNMWVDSQGGG
ncbi:MAG: hypothetical protein ACYC6G_11430 [Desulfobaccales bacterium]